MTLNTDTARCNGHAPFGIIHAPCRDCQRRTELVHHDYRQSWMKPNVIFSNVCDARIAPEGEK